MSEAKSRVKHSIEMTAVFLAFCPLLIAFFDIGAYFLIDRALIVNWSWWKGFGVFFWTWLVIVATNGEYP